MDTALTLQHLKHRFRAHPSQPTSEITTPRTEWPRAGIKRSGEPKAPEVEPRSRRDHRLKPCKSQGETILVMCGFARKSKIPLSSGRPSHLPTLMSTLKSAIFGLVFMSLSSSLSCGETAAPIGGDFNGDGLVTEEDLNTLSSKMLTGNPTPAFDLDANGQVDFQDFKILVHERLCTWFGDANLDGEFNDADIVQVFKEGKYKTGERATWSQGDWNGDRVFDLNDLLVADADGGFHQGPFNGVGGARSGRLPLSVFELFGETRPFALDIVTFSIGETEGVLLSWETTTRTVQLQRASSLQNNWIDVAAEASPDDDGRTYVALTGLPSSNFFRLSFPTP